MSATTASERARELTDVLIGASIAIGRTTKLASRAALLTERIGLPRKELLAYLAALEACVAAARAVVRMEAGSNCLTAERNRLFTALAAVDAPATEDGR